MKKMLSRLSLILLLPLLSCGAGNAHPQNKKKDKKEKEQTEMADSSAQLTIEKRLDLSKDLVEISGMALYGGAIAAIQDEDGTIFMLNKETGVVDRKIPFGPFGDYEGITVVGETAWVLRSDGHLFELPQFARAMTAIIEHVTPLTAKNNCEGLTYDKANNRLLVAVKDRDPLGGKDYKGVYAFDLRLKKLLMDPVYKLGAVRDNEETRNQKKAKKEAVIHPSEIAVHPKTGELYVLDGPAGGLLVFGENGNLVREYALPKKDFPQAEGLIISPAGEVYISNEGGKGTATILKVSEPVMPAEL